MANLAFKGKLLLLPSLPQRLPIMLVLACTVILLESISSGLCKENVKADFYPRKIPLSHWFSIRRIESVEKTRIDCGRLCFYSYATVSNPCNALIFDTSNNVCTRATSSTGLRVAWASSTRPGGGFYPFFAIDKVAQDGLISLWSKKQMWFNDISKGPLTWIAVDLLSSQVVTSVEMFFLKGKRRNGFVE